MPAQSLILDGPRTGGAKIQAACAADGSFAFVYSLRGEPFTLCMDVVKSSQVRASWFDPRYGIETHLHTSDSPGIQIFVPPTSGSGCDWVLVLERAE